MQMVLEENSFVLGIIVVPLPKNFKKSMIEAYDGVQIHLIIFGQFIWWDYMQIIFTNAMEREEKDKDNIQVNEGCSVERWGFSWLFSQS